MEQRELSWDDVERLATSLAHALQGRQFDSILGVLRGGLVPACLLSRLLGVRRVLAASVASYSDEQQTRAATPHLAQFPSAAHLRGKQVLIVDDIWDSGRTAIAVRREVEAAGGSPTLAVLHFKPTTNAFATEAPDAYAATTDVWVVYPWERMPRLPSTTERGS